MRRHRTIQEYHWVGRANWGDAMAPCLLERFADLPRIISGPIDSADVITVGSVIEHVPPEWQGIILGAGRLSERSKISLNPHVKILGLRGPLTAYSMSYSGISRDCAIGDPGLLADELVGSQSRIYDLGIVPHWSDNDLAKDPRFVGHKWSTLIINPADPPLTVIRQIGQCQKIVSSSLHGLIVADAFGIPRRFETTPRFDKEGGLYKFHDYSASIGATLEIGNLYRANTHLVDDRKHELYDAYQELGRLLRH